MTTDGVVNTAGFRRMDVENRWSVDKWNAPRGLLWEVSERGANAADRFKRIAFTLSILCRAPRRRYATRADLRKYGVTIGCAACSENAVHGKTATP